MDEKRRTARPVIGWREWIELPEFDIARIKVKIDTGARSSSLHAFDIEYFRRRGMSMVRFKVHPIQRDASRTVVAEAPLLDRRWVTNSGGTPDLRPVIETLVRFMGEQWPIELTLARRDVMGFRMLLGRQAVRRRFVVDPGNSFFGGRPLRKKKVGKTKKSDAESTASREGVRRS